MYRTYYVFRNQKPWKIALTKKSEAELKSSENCLLLSETIAVAGLLAFPELSEKAINVWEKNDCLRS